MKIDHYSFGKIIIDGKAYTRDLIIYPQRIDSSWWRREGHLLQIEDLSEVIKEKPDILIIGTGYNGVMKVPEETVANLRSKGIEVIIKKTTEVVEVFNNMKKDKKVIAVLHLTC
jgi:hypothetical protein